MKKPISIAVIDDGINRNMIANDIRSSIMITNDLDIVPYQITDKEKLTHGTICASIIESYFHNAVFSSVRILSDRMRGSINQLVKSLEWCMLNDIDVVNISLGSHYSKDKDILKKVINQVTEKGLIIVCASDNNDYLTFPASFSNVIGVKRDSRNILWNNEYSINKNIIDGIEFTAYSRHKLSIKGNYICSDSNSFAAPFITAKVCELMSKHSSWNIDTIKYELIRGANNYENYKGFIYPRPDWIEKALICYVNHKIHISYEFLAINLYDEIVISNDILVEELNTAVSTILSDCDNSFDSIILISDDSIGIKEKDVCFMASKYNKNVVFLYGNSCLENGPIGKYNLSNIKMWNNYFKLNSLLDMEISNRYINESVVTIILPKELCLEDLIPLYSKFIDDDYNPYFCTDNVLGTLYDIEYIPPDLGNDKILKYMSYVLDKSGYDIAIIVNSIEYYIDDNILESDIRITIFQEEKNYIVDYNIDNSSHIRKEYPCCDFIDDMYDTIIDILG
ncbi:hypothetical protein AN2V17_41420 [Vallitalea sp. AN17-2]|uniref:Uncharacterized protein n=2 Tax=Vallitalea maricola TaxID=3074433 RepID=A0ACB5UPI5_9FIRM|nr:hypothetical protein AN2V17_41420 [Vallitalea sp. AN17-2]